MKLILKMYVLEREKKDLLHPRGDYICGIQVRGRLVRQPQQIS